jgi:hypothetical protein
MKYTSYREYREHPVFKAVRKAAWRLTGPQCEQCGAIATEMHHARYPAWGAFDTPGNMRALCHQCHCLAHSQHEMKL